MERPYAERIDYIDYMERPYAEQLKYVEPYLLGENAP